MWNRDAKHLGRAQRIIYDGVEYHVTLKSVRWQPRQRHLQVSAAGGVGGSRDGTRARGVMSSTCAVLPTGPLSPCSTRGKRSHSRRSPKPSSGEDGETSGPDSLRSLAVSRFLAASIVGQVAEQAFLSTCDSTHYPGVDDLSGETSPMLASGRDLWLGYRFFSEDAYAWARRSAGSASRVVALYFADTKYQFRTDLPSGTEVQSIAQLDSTELGGRYADLILALLRGLEVPAEAPPPEQLVPIVLGRIQAPATPVAEADVHEALAALKRPCGSKAEFRYQLAAGVVLNAWIEEERRLGFSQRKRFYAFKQQIGALAKWAAEAKLPGVRLWIESPSGPATPILYVRIDDVDFSFHAIPTAQDFLDSGHEQLTWSGVRLKPIAPIVLAWARSLLKPDTNVTRFE